MSSTRTAYRTALRLIRMAPARNVVIAGTIAVPTTVAIAALIADWDAAPALVISAIGATVAMLMVAQASPEPTSLASAQAWRAVGAGPRSAGRPQRIATRLVGWAGVSLGVVGGTLLGGGLDHRHDLGSPSMLSVNIARPAIALLVGLGFVVPGSVALVRRRKEPHRTRPRHWRGLRLGLGVVLVAAAGALDVGVAGSVRTDFDAALAIPIATLLTVIVVVTALGLVTTWLTRLAERFASWRAAAHLAGRRPGSVLVRLVVVSAMVVAVTGFTLGTSVAARSRQIPVVTAELQRLPVVPPNVMVLERCCQPPSLADPAQVSGETSAFSLANIGDVARRFPGSAIIPVTELSGPHSGLRFSCPFSRLEIVIPSDAVTCSEPVVLADPRLDRIFGPPGDRSTPLFMSRANATPGDSLVCSDQTSCRAVSGRANVPSPSDAMRARLRGEPLPKATWTEERFIEVDHSALSGTRLTPAVRTLIITRATPYSAADRRSLRRLATDGNVSGHLGAGWTSDQRSEGFGNTASGTVPWAPTDASTQWSIAIVASLLALLVVVGTGAVDALDRRRDNRRLEVLGATPGQVRAGSALHAALELGTAAALAATVVSGLVAFGVHRYSTAVPDFPLKFVLPLPQLALLVLGVPAVGAAIAAGVARFSSETSHPTSAAASR